MNVTKHEELVLIAFTKNDIVRDYGYDNGGSTWVTNLSTDLTSKMNGRVFSGLMSSLVKKGFMITNGESCSLTEEGVKVTKEILNRKKEKEMAEEKIKGISNEIYEQATEIIVSGYQHKADIDEIKGQVYELGVRFSKLNTLYKAILKEQNLYVNTAELRENILDTVNSLDLTFEESLEELKEKAEEISSEITGSTPGQVVTALRKLYKEAEKEFPKKVTSGKGRIGSVNKALIDAFSENPQISEDDLRGKLESIVKTTKNAFDYARQYHKMLFAVANGMSSDELSTALSENRIPVSNTSYKEEIEESE